jgi:hypothetical protein
MADGLDILNRLKVTTSFGDEILNRAKNDAQAIQAKGNSAIATAEAQISGAQTALEYLLDTSVFLLGTGFLTESINKFLTSLLKRDKDGKIIFELQVKQLVFDALTKGLEDKLVPDEFITDGYVLPVPLMDLFDLFKIDPTSPEGTTFYGRNGFNRNFFQKILQSSATTPFLALQEMPGILFQYNLILNTVTVKGDPSILGKTIKEVLGNIILADNFVLIDTSRLIADVLNTLYNFLGGRKTARALRNEEMLDAVVAKISQEMVSERVYSFSNEEKDKINATVVRRRQGGYVLDAACELQKVVIDPAMINTVSDPQNYTEFLMNLLDVHLQVNNVEKNGAIVDNYSKGLMKAFLLTLIHHSLLSPSVWLLFLLTRIFRVGYPQTKYADLIASGVGNLDIGDLIKDHSNIFDKLSKRLQETILNYFMDILLKALLKKLTPFLVKIGKEKAENYLAILESLI